MDARGPLSNEASRGATGERLDSWKAIAVYLRRDVTTVQRWERREGMPVHRHVHQRRGSVYAFRPELDEWWRSRAAGANPPEQVGDGMAPAAPEGSASDWHRTARSWGWVGLAVLLAAVAAQFSWGRTSNAARAPFESVAVLPLENLSGDPTQDYVANGMTEALIGSLARIDGLKVISRTSVMRFKGTDQPLSAIARALDVEVVVVGSVQRAGDRLAVRVQLIHGPTDAHVWAGEYERRVGDALALQADVGRAVADQVHGQIDASHETVRRVETVEPAAYHEYLRGRFHLWKFREAHLATAVEHFERAIALEPGYAAAYAGLAYAWWVRGVFGALDLSDVEAPARRAVRKALELDDRLSEAYAVQGYLEAIFDRDWTRAERTIQRALDLDSNNVDAHYTYALLLMALERPEEAIAQIAMAAERDPFSAQIHSTYGRVLYRARRFEEAIARLQHAIALDPDNGVALGRLGDVYAQLGRFQDALAAYDRAQTAGAAADMQRALVYARMGRRTEAEQLLEQVRVRKNGEPLSAAGAYVALGRADAAFRVLFDNHEERRRLDIFIKADPRLVELHDDPRWKVLLARMKFPA